MMAVLLGAGTGLLLAGLAAIVYGLPIKEFSFGSTMILAGVVTACSGAIMLGLFVVARQLQNIARGLGDGIAVAPYEEPALQPAAAPRGQPGDIGGLPFGRDRPSGENAGAARPVGTASQGSGPAEAPQPGVAAVPAKPRRNLLFSSTSRKERERAAQTGEPLTPDLLSPDLRPPLSEAPRVSEPVNPPPATFEDAWPKPERGRPGETQPPPRRAGRSPPAFANGDTPSGSANRDAPPQVTVLKSGVVDGMAYSLYSDGSIEAQMPEGMMRFASIDELRAHLDQRP
jgi:hypothetical protein